MAATEIEVLLRVIDQAWDGESWHGQNLRGAIRRVSAEDAAWRPAPRRHNIHELVVHAAYWKHISLQRLTGAEKGMFPYKGSNWFVRKAGLDPKIWKSDVALLVETHDALRTAIAALTPGDLRRVMPGAKWNCLDTVAGVAAHDLYHTGQIQLIKKLRRR